MPTGVSTVFLHWENDAAPLNITIQGSPPARRAGGVLEIIIYMKASNPPPTRKTVNRARQYAFDLSDMRKSLDSNTIKLQIKFDKMCGFVQTVRMSKVNTIKPSDVYLAAWVAAEEALPEESRELIRHHHKLQAQWLDADGPSPVPAELSASFEAIMADPCAKIAFLLRQQCDSEAIYELNRQSL